MNAFEVLKKEGSARAAKLSLAHGVVETPAFMPVGTNGVVKTLSSEDLRSVGSQIVLGNTYHLYLRPGTELLERFGGLHSFMRWNGPILTDSGGFQVFSLAKIRTVTDEGISFQSHLNGDSLFLTPELSAQIQQIIGSDIAMVLDECVSLPNCPQVIAQAVERSLLWAKRFLDVPRRDGQKLFGIVQGGTDLPLRMRSLEGILEMGFDGIAIGGLSVGEPHSQMIAMLSQLSPRLPENLPHYLMGVGTPKDLLESVRLGIDLFDCVLPTRNGRNGGFFTPDGLLNIKNQAHLSDDRPVDPTCRCLCCQNYSRAYLRHLFQLKEILGCRLATLHNLHYYHRLMRDMRELIQGGTFEAYYGEMSKRLAVAYPERRGVSIE